jgi:hypothetical protein
MKQNADIMGWPMQAGIGLDRVALSAARLDAVPGRSDGFVGKALFLFACGAAPWLGIIWLLRAL